MLGRGRARRSASLSTRRASCIVREDNVRYFADLDSLVDLLQIEDGARRKSPQRTLDQAERAIRLECTSLAVRQVRIALCAGETLVVARKVRIDRAQLPKRLRDVARSVGWRRRCLSRESDNRIGSISDLSLPFRGGSIEQAPIAYRHRAG